MAPQTFLLAVLFALLPLRAQASDFKPDFRKDFQWCVANAAFQVEGSPADSDWLRWTHAPGRIEDGANADRVIDFWNQYEREFDLARNLGVRSFRLSIAWERIEPKADQWDEQALAHYEKMLLALRARGIEPIVTLQHFVLPEWLAEKGGLLSPDFPQLFGIFSERVFRRLGLGQARVRWWLTFNEPAVLVRSGYIEGSWPPGKNNDFKSATQGLAQIARAHFEAVRRIRALSSSSPTDQIQIGFAKHWRPFEPKTRSPLDWIAAKVTDWAFNRQILDAFAYGRVRIWMPGGGLIWETLKLPEGEKSLDYIGINYYGRNLVSLSSHPPFVEVTQGSGPQNDIGWEIYPEGLATVIREARGYGLPLLISENGIADRGDRWRGKFIEDHLTVIKKAIDQGAPILGYCHWTLTDNFEWARGFSAKFGLSAFDPKTLERKPRGSFYELQRRIRSGL